MLWVVGCVGRGRYDILAEDGYFKMEKTSFQKLDIYRLAEVLADNIWEIVANWDRLAQDTVGRQLVRAADSIGANIAEGLGRGSYAETSRFAKIARGSLFEVKHWLRRAFQRNLLSEEEIKNLRKIIDELTPRLSAYINSFKDKL